MMADFGIRAKEVWLLLLGAAISVLVSTAISFELIGTGHMESFMSGFMVSVLAGLTVFAMFLWLVVLVGQTSKGIERRKTRRLKDYDTKITQKAEEFEGE